MKPLGLQLSYRSIKRLRRIIRVFAKYGFKPLMARLRLLGALSVSARLGVGRGPAVEDTPAVRARLAMEELGPTFIKLGQILSTRPDVVPEEFVVEFLKLQDTVPPFPFSDVVKVIEAELKRPVGAMFSSIEQTPAAAASIAQVHRAVTVSGDEVVIKVQRPGIEETIETDAAIMMYLARLAQRHVAETRIYDPVGMVDEFSLVIKKELDFTMEASYTEKIRELFSGDPRVVVPRVHWDLTGRRVLTMQRVGGIKIDNVAGMREAGIDTGRVARLLAEVFFRQVFEFGLFHGDLHSGNIFVVDEGRIALVDFGIVGRIDKTMKANLADILIGFATEDFDALTKVYLKMGILPESIDSAAFEREYYDIMLHYFGRPFRHVRMGELLLDYAKLAARHRVKLPRELLLFDKCVIELEGLARTLYPDADILEESRPFAEKLLAERVGPGAAAKEAAAALSDWRDLLGDAPAMGSQLLKKLAEDRFRIEFMHKGLEEFMGEMDRSSNRLTFGIIVAALIVGSSLVIGSEAGPLVLGYPALGIAGFLTASILGLWLAAQILRSGKF